MTINLPLKKVYLVFLATFIFSIHIPVAFATNLIKKDFTAVLNTSEPAVASKAEAAMMLYNNLELGLKGLSEDAFTLALQGYDKLVSMGRIADKGIISIADFSKSSNQKRLFVIDIKSQKILFHTYVAHGRNSGEEYATKFSNVPESFTSSLGFYTTESPYTGSNGYSLHLKGLEAGINDKAYERAIVMHGADYADDNFRQMKGYLGRSYGCPAVPQKMNKPIIDKIKYGTCLFIYANKGDYLAKSKIV